MERLSKKNFGENNYQLAGLRFIYTVYPEDRPDETQYMNDIDQNYRSKHSLLLVPTYFNGNDYIDYDPLHYHVESGSNVPDNFESLTTKEEVSVYDPLHPCNNGTNTMNHGSMCPPTCPPIPSFLSVMDSH